MEPKTWNPHLAGACRPVIRKMKYSFAVGLLGLAISLQLGEAGREIVFKRVDEFDRIYRDRGTGADRDVSIWRPKTAENGYFALGDTAVNNHGSPVTSTVMVKADGSDALVVPQGFTEIWNDRGSGGDQDVRIMQMNAASGYICLGHVAVIGYGSLPNGNLYRCVKSNLVTRGKYSKIWLDRGSGASRDVGIWLNMKSEDRFVHGMDLNTFTAFGNHRTPGGRPYLLDGRYALDHLNEPLQVNPNLALTVYEMSRNDVDVIWTDRGSGANRDIAVWRSKGPSNYYSLGDIAVGGGRPSHGYLVKIVKDDALRSPTGFRRIWKDSGSGASWDGSFWQPVCPSGYRTLGYVSMRSYRTPSPNSVHCVKHSYVVRGAWQFVWNDRGSGADRDVSIYKAVAGSDGQGVDAMGAVGSYRGMGHNAYVLKASVVDYVTGKPATKYILQDVHYLFDDRNVLDSEPETLERTIIENRGNSTQTSERLLSYTYTETSSWSNQVGLEVGVTTTVTAGVPLTASASVAVTVTASYSYTWGESVTETKQDQTRVIITVQPRSQKTASVVGRRYTMNIPYTARLITEYADGSTGTRENYRGVFYGVQVNEIRVVYDADIALSST